MTLTYTMTVTVLLIGLVLMFWDVSRKMKNSEHRKISVVLIGTSMFYVVMDCIWIIIYNAEDFQRGWFVLINFLFYMVYITLPYIWFLFARCFIEHDGLIKKQNYLFALPWLFNIVLVLLTLLGVEALWTIGDSANRYERGPLFGVLSNLNLFYYFVPIVMILFFLYRKKGAEKRILLTMLGFSTIPALGVFFYIYWIPVEAIYPLQPCCFFIGVMFAYILVLTEVYKKTENENVRLTEVTKAAQQLSELMSSVGELLTNMPALTFSKDANTGVYLACNQAFAEYAHKDSPEKVVGLTDYDIFDPVTAKHFVEDDRKACGMEEPYIFLEDVPDAVGMVRNLQTTKLTFRDGVGRLCLLGMSVDVTEMSRAKVAETEMRIKQRELEEKLILHEKLMEQERSRARQNMLIAALASDYRSVFYVDLDKDEAICYQKPEEIYGYNVGQHFAYMQNIMAYADKFVLKEYRDEFLQFVQPESIRENLDKYSVISYRYLTARDGKEMYVMIRFAGVRQHEDEKDGAVHAVGLSFTNVDAETRMTMEQNSVLKDALTAAEVANKAKSAFLSKMSHEIRTPMNAIIGLGNIALEDATLSESTRGYLEKIGNSAQHLLGVINDILDMSRIESGRMSIKSEEFSFAKLLEHVNTIISSQCNDKGVNYECRIKGTISDCYIGDDTKLSQIMLNILGNAVKFTPEGGSVTLIVEEVVRFDGKSTLRFTFIDTGIGMSRKYLPSLFDAFSQEDSFSTNRYGSTGLGMPITKSIVELMNGNIEVESEKGKGTTFTVTVTLLDSERKDEEEGALHLQEMCVLVIDDDPIACEQAQMVLGQVGINSEMALSGTEALEMIKVRYARRRPYNLILVDWKMPDMDGVEVTRQIRSAGGNETPIIMLTSYNWEDIVDEAKTAVVDTFLAKPLSAENVLEVFRETISKKNAQLETESTSLSGRRVLLAEDVEVNAEIMMVVLSGQDIDVDWAENGRIAVDMFGEHEVGYYDAILMDMRMPEMDGLEATRVIRTMEREDAKTIPIIALTANAFDEDVQQSMQAGLNAHLSKPIEQEALFKTLEGLLNKKAKF